MAPDQIYTRALNADQIRVMALQKGEGDDRLACQLRILDAHDKGVPYEAISYVWGSRETPAVISCKVDDKGTEIDVPITKNAYDALRAVREPQMERLIWIDSICISQTSPTEKAAQVAMMDRIFTNAQAVLVWLGVEDETRPAAAKELFDRIDTQPMGFELDPTQGSIPSPLYAVKGNHTRYHTGEVEMLLSVFESEWFWRLWCVQELVLARKAVVYWGSSRVPWEAFSATAAFLETHDGYIIARVGFSGVYNGTMLESFRSHLRGTPARTLPFSRLLNLTRMHGVTEHHDRIFSLLGLEGYLCRNNPGSPQEQEQALVTPNYLQKLEDLYSSVARELLARERNLYLLSFVQHEKEVETSKLPSWIPQWHINRHRLITQFDLISGHPVNESFRAAWAKTSTKNQASTNTDNASEPTFDITSEGTLRAEGLLLDTVVVKCSNATFASKHSREWIDTLRHWFRGVVVWYIQRYQHCAHSPLFRQLEELAFRVFYKTILGGQLIEWDHSGEVRLALLQESCDFRDLVLSRACDDLDSCPATQAIVTQMCRSRTLFFTQHGRLGLGPQCVRVEDTICFLHGAAIPLLMRPRQDAPARWLLVGETYVNGLLSVSHDDDGAKELDVQRTDSQSDTAAPRPRQPECDCRTLDWKIETREEYLENASDSAIDVSRVRDQSEERQKRLRTWDVQVQRYMPISGERYDYVPDENFDAMQAFVHNLFFGSSASQSAPMSPQPEDLDFGERVRFLID